MFARPIIPIPPSYDGMGGLDITNTNVYLNHLSENGAQCVMTTEGTSQFNLMDQEEVHLFNKLVYSFPGEKILGVPSLPLNKARDFIRNMVYEDNTSIMALYPDRYYDDESVILFFKLLSSSLGKPIYIHTKPLRNGRGGEWNYTAKIINSLFREGWVKGIKEEHSSLAHSYNFVLDLDPGLDIIVAGGSMRRFQYLRNAGATTFLAGVGSIFPHIENQFLSGDCSLIKMENQMFKVFMKHGWHPSLREGLKQLGLGCQFNRQPWPTPTQEMISEITAVLNKIKNEK